MNINHEKKPIHYYKGHRFEMLEFIPDKLKKVLEVGCGEGNFGQIIKNIYNAEVWGVDIQKSTKKILKNKLDYVYIGDFNKVSIKLPNNYFDCIIFNDTLEHMENPWDTLIKCRKLLNVKGVIVASIPNFRYINNLIEILIKGDYEYKNKGILDRTHLRFFTEKSIKRLFDESDYEIIKLKGINPLKVIKFCIPFFFINLLTLKYFNDIRYQQFAICVKPKKE